MPNIKHWKSLGFIMDKAKEKIRKEYRIVDTCFTSFATTGGNLFTRIRSFLIMYTETLPILCQ